MVLILIWSFVLSGLSNQSQARAEDVPTEMPAENHNISTATWATGPANQTLMTLNIQDAIEQALSRNPDVNNDRERIKEDEKNIDYAYSQLFPTVVGTGTGTRQKDAVVTGNANFGGNAYNNYNVAIKASQPLYVGGAITAGLGVVKKDKQIREKDLEVVERDLSVQVIEAFYTVLLNQQLVALLNQTLAVEKESLATTQKYARIGRSQLLDVLQIKTQIALLYPQITSTENTMKNSAAQLTTLLHENQARTVKLQGDLKTVDFNGVMALVANRRELPEVIRSRLQISQFDDQKTVTLAPNYPSLALVGTIGRSANTQSDLLNDYSTQWSVGLQLTIPIFSGLSSIYQRAALNDQTTELEFGQQKLLDTVSFNQVQAERNLGTAKTVLDRSREAAELSDQSLNEARRDYRLQTISYLQFLTSEQNYLAAESAYIQAKYGYIDAVAKFFQTSGIALSNLVQLLVQR